MAAETLAAVLWRSLYPDAATYDATVARAVALLGTGGVRVRVEADHRETRVYVGGK